MNMRDYVDRGVSGEYDALLVYRKRLRQRLSAQRAGVRVADQEPPIFLTGELPTTVVGNSVGNPAKASTSP